MATEVICGIARAFFRLELRLDATDFSCGETVCGIGRAAAQRIPKQKIQEQHTQQARISTITINPKKA